MQAFWDIWGLYIDNEDAFLGDIKKQFGLVYADNARILRAHITFVPSGKSIIYEIHNHQVVGQEFSVLQGTLALQGETFLVVPKLTLGLD